MEYIWDILYKNRYSTNTGVTFIIENEDIFIPYSELIEKSEELSSKYKAIGIKARQKVIFQIESPIFFIIAFWACQHLKAIPVLLNKARTPSEQEFLNRVLISFKDFVLIYDDEKYIFSEMTQMHLQNSDSIETTNKFSQEDTALILFTSGTTREAKGIEISHKNIIGSILGGFEKLMNVDVNKDFWISWLPLTHIAGLAGFHIFPVAMNINHAIMKPFVFIEKPNILLEKIKEYGVTHTFLTNMALNLLIDLASNTKMPFNLKSLKVVMIGSELINHKQCELFLQMFNDFGLSRNTLTPVYGLSEAGGACTVSLNELRIMYFSPTLFTIGKKVHLTKNSFNAAVGLISTGKIHPSIELKICDENENNLGLFHIGLIYLKGNPVSNKIFDFTRSQIYKDEAKTIKDFWYNTGDLGVMTEDGLFVIGRYK